MAQFSTYGHVFEVPDAYAEGHPLTAKEAAALNGLRAELISHKVRALLSGEGFAYSKGMTLENPDHITAAETLVKEESASFEFGAGRGPGSPRVVLDPVAKTAMELAEKEVRAAIKASPQFDKVGKKDGSDAGPRIYPFERFRAKVEEIAQRDSIVAAAKKIVAQANKAESGEFEL